MELGRTGKNRMEGKDDTFKLTKRKTYLGHVDARKNITTKLSFSSLTIITIHCKTSPRNLVLKIRNSRITKLCRTVKRKPIILTIHEQSTEDPLQVYRNLKCLQ